MYIPAHPRRAWLRAYWTSLTILAALVFIVLFMLRISGHWMMWGGALLFFTGPIAIWKPDTIKYVYDIGYRIAEIYLRVMRIVLKAVCFFVVFVVVGRGGSALTLHRPRRGGSMWTARDTIPAANYPQEYEKALQSSREDSWVHTFISWAKGSGNVWAVTLLPFLLLLAVLEPEEENLFPANIYTLF